MKTIHLTHPIHNCPAVADVTGYHRENGRNIGLKLQFPDGHTASLTYTEIGELQDGPTTEAAPVVVVTAALVDYTHPCGGGHVL